MGVAKSQAFTKAGQCLYRTGHGKYFAIVKVGGKQIKRSLKTTDRQLAERRLREFQDKTARLHGFGVEKSLLFQDLTKRWLDSIKPELKPNSYNRRVTAVKGLMPFFKGELVRSIGHRQIEEWKKKRGALIAPQTWNIEIETLRLLLNYAKDKLQILLDNPADSIKRKKVGKSKTLIPSKDQFRALIQELRTGHKATGEAADFVEFLGYCGCRQTEGFNVRWRDINFDLGSILITGGETGTKNNEMRSLPLFPPLRRLLLEIEYRKPNAGPQDRVFEIQDARLQIARACERLGLPRLGHHSMRHFFCSNAIEAGIDFKVIAEWLGHKDGGVLVAKTYGHLRNEHSAAMAKRMTFDATAEKPNAGVIQLSAG